jgi:peroxiredoxin
LKNKLCLLLVSLIIGWQANLAWAVGLDQAAPDFTLRSLSGENLRLQEYRGKVVLINFWASWCGPCRQEMPILDRIHKRYEPAGFTVLGVNVEGELDKARKIADRLDVSFPLLFDAGQQVSEDYALKSMPYTVLVDRDGQIRFIHHGYKPGDENKYIDRLKTLLRR